MEEKRKKKEAGPPKENMRKDVVPPTYVEKSRHPTDLSKSGKRKEVWGSGNPNRAPAGDRSFLFSVGVPLLYSSSGLPSGASFGSANAPLLINSRDSFK